MRLWRKMKNKLMKPEESAKLDKWKKKYENAKNDYQSTQDLIKHWEKLYDGTRTVNGNPNKKQAVTKESLNVRNIVYELIESQTDSSIPMPKVIPIHEEDVELAQIIENALENEVRRLHFHELNDVQERTVPITGGDYFFVEWDNLKSYHCTIGNIAVSERHPKYVIPQPGITSIEEMDYLFIVIPTTKEAVKSKYGIDIADANDTNQNIDERSAQAQEEITDIVKCYYKHDGVIGLLSWVEEYVLEDYEDYQARRLWRCVKCGRPKVGDVCECGSKKFKQEVETGEELIEDTVIFGGEVLPQMTMGREPVLDPYGEPMLNEIGEPIMAEVETRTKIPYYKPDAMPLVLRRNVSKENKLLGVSDVKVIEDQQDAIKKLGSKMQEKLLKGGSIVTKPRRLQIETTDRELKVVNVENPADVDMITVKNIQADVTMDRIMLETNYDWAKSTLGITDSYQGKYDSSATSGTAKQYSINQAAGRLESKRVMKNTAYAKLYELMFKFMLAYADQPIPLSKKNSQGVYEFSHFNRYDFLKRDDSGKLYWDDEFLFEVDPTSTIMMNREAMWQQIDLKYQAGAFGQIGTPDALLSLWTFLAENDYPNAETMKKKFEQQVQQQQQMQQQMQMMQMMQMQGGGQNGMPKM